MIAFYLLCITYLYNFYIHWVTLHLLKIFDDNNNNTFFQFFQEPGTWTPSKPFDQGGCEEEASDKMAIIIIMITIILIITTIIITK